MAAVDDQPRRGNNHPTITTANTAQPNTRAGDQQSCVPFQTKTWRATPPTAKHRTKQQNATAKNELYISSATLLVLDTNASIDSCTPQK
eukprot:NODE_2199_length_819_cov_176.588312_g1538_i0.p3 GENE.NODE_2199_length_819_cov_176.588312_g1538_i0~~NODE_2199_length_819_cov_176.588312_g1538_i0.p3  ORF type:complete len:89 (-),score=3.30 NODE_2199_length_819_cov_176.588312_g1538_i0:440-706(-)